MTPERLALNQWWFGMIVALLGASSIVGVGMWMQAENQQGWSR